MHRIARHLATFDPFTFELDEQILRRAEEPVDLAPRTLGILQYLIENRDRSIPNDELMERFWPGVTVSVDSVHKQISEIRRALGDSAKEPRFIETRYKRGCRFIAPVEIAGQTPSPKKSRPGPNPLLLLFAGTLVAFAGFWIWLGSAPREARVIESTQLTWDGNRKWGPLLTDGKVIFFRQEFGGTTRIASIPVSGGTTEAIAPALLNNAELYGISSNGAKLLVQLSNPSEQGLWIFDRRTQTRKLVRAGIVESAALSPSGTRVAMTNGIRLSITKADGSLEREATLPGLPESLAWSPSGDAIRFPFANYRGADPSSEGEYDLRTRTMRRLFQMRRVGELLGAGVLSHSGKYFVYPAGKKQQLDLWIAPEKGRFVIPGTQDLSAKRLTNGAPGSWIAPATSADNESTIFALNHYARPELVRFDAGKKMWRPMWQSAGAFELSYSQDAQQVAYVNFPDHSIWKARPDGSARVQLTGGGRDAHQPHWSPDGTHIAYMAENAKEEWHIFQVSALGGPSEQITTEGAQGVPTWAPDGRTLLFGERLSEKPRTQMAIHSLDLATKKITEMAGTSGLWSPRWSPDGRFILAISADFGELRVLRANVLPGEWKTLVRSNSVDNATWSTDSRYIHFNGIEEDGERWLYRVSVATGQVERIVALSGFDYPADVWFGVGADGAPLALRAARMEEIFRLKCEFP